jgi:hypothetical protein
MTTDVATLDITRRAGFFYTLMNFFRSLPRAAKTGLLLSTLFFVVLEAQCARGVWLLLSCHAHLRQPWFYFLMIFMPWGFSVRGMWLLSKLAVLHKIQEDDAGAVMTFLAAIPFWSYFLVGLGIEFASVARQANYTLPFF